MTNDNEKQQEASYDPSSSTDAKIDFNMMIASQSPINQEICIRLRDGHSINSIARTLHVSKLRVRNVITKVIHPIAQDYVCSGKPSTPKDAEDCKVSQNATFLKNERPREARGSFPAKK